MDLLRTRRNQPQDTPKAFPILSRIKVELPPRPRWRCARNSGSAVKHVAQPAIDPRAAETGQPGERREQQHPDERFRRLATALQAPSSNMKGGRGAHGLAQGRTMSPPRSSAGTASIRRAVSLPDLIDTVLPLFSSTPLCGSLSTNDDAGQSQVWPADREGEPPAIADRLGNIWAKL